MLVGDVVPDTDREGAAVGAALRLPSDAAEPVEAVPRGVAGGEGGQEVNGY